MERFFTFITIMKYTQLTKEQFEELHQEFATFLATQQIDVKEWDTIKKEKPNVAQEEMNIFSDMVWEKVLSTAKYLEHFSKSTINLFRCNTENIDRIVIQITDDTIDLLTEEGYKWLFENSSNKSIEYYSGEKPYQKERNSEIFDLIEKGSIISKGELYEATQKLISK